VAVAATDGLASNQKNNNQPEVAVVAVANGDFGKWPTINRRMMVAAAVGDGSDAGNGDEGVRKKKK